MGYIFALLFLLLVVAAVPLMITIIYQFFYNNHVNKSLSEELPLRRWLSPLAVFVLLILAEAVLYVSVMFLFTVRVKEGSDMDLSHDICIEVMVQEQVDSSLLSMLNDPSQEIYKAVDHSSSDISCQVYKISETPMMPSYVIRLDCNALPENAACWDVDVKSEHTSGAIMSDFGDSASRTIYVLLNGEMADEKNITCSFNVYTGSMDDYSTGAMGTYDMPQPMETLEFKLQ